MHNLNDSIDLNESIDAASLESTDGLIDHPSQNAAPGTVGDRSGDAVTSRQVIVERRAPRAPRNFPGGAARLPRINRPSADVPEFNHPLQDDDPRHADPLQAGSTDQGFDAYYSTESLFGGSPDPGAFSAEEEGPYGVLGLTRDASWEAVSKAHRRLVAQLHPDRYVREDDQIREAAERRVRDVNEAFSTIRRERAAHR